MELNANREAVEYYSGDRDLAEAYRQYITQGLNLVDDWNSNRFGGF
jgi:hypothetical protein